MKINVVNRQKLRRPAGDKLKAVTRFFMTKALPAAANRAWGEISLVLTDDDGIRQINRQFFDRDCVTDVISFLLRPQPEKNKSLPAEIVINVEQAGREGNERRGIDHEFALYLAHGCDHLAGHDDRLIKARNRMRRRELRWLKEAAKARILCGLFAFARTPCGSCRAEALRRRMPQG